MRLTALAILTFGIVALLLGAVAFQPLPGARAQEDEVEIWVLGVEFKGTAGADEPYIAEGDKVERYVFVPDQIVVQQGQHVHLHFLGVNGGGGHTTTIENYVTAPFTFFRNQTVDKEFVADKPGVFKIVCSNHPPTMVAELIVEEPAPAAGLAGINVWSGALLGAQAILFVVTLVLILRRPKA
ncbi:MAG: hypothetical protein ACE5NC_11680 [Anaerolineae bacterium]